MNYQFPHTIKNCIGETLIFKEIVQEADGDKVLVENFVTPNSGPPMHTHFLQEEALMRVPVPALVLLSLCAFSASAADAGLSVGNDTVPFHPQHLTGADKGTATCPP